MSAPPPRSNLHKPPPKAAPGARAPLAPPPAPPAVGNKPTRPPMAASHPGKPPAVAGRPGQPAATGPAGPAATKAAAGTAKAMPKIDPRTLPGSLGPMVEAIQVYDDLLIEENEALKAGDSKAVEALLDRKMAATRLYQERLRALLAEPQNKRGITPEQRSLVTAMVRRLEERAKENTTLLKANMKAIEQLFEVINTAARRMRRQDVSYSKAGMMCDGYIRNGVSLAYNNTI